MESQIFRKRNLLLFQQVRLFQPSNTRPDEGWIRRCAQSGGQPVGDSSNRLFPIAEVEQSRQSPAQRHPSVTRRVDDDELVSNPTLQQTSAPRQWPIKFWLHRLDSATES